MLDVQAGVAYLTFDNTNLLPFLRSVERIMTDCVRIITDFVGL